MEKYYCFYRNKDYKSTTNIYTNKLDNPDEMGKFLETKSTKIIKS